MENCNLNEFFLRLGLGLIFSALTNKNRSVKNLKTLESFLNVCTNWKKKHYCLENNLGRRLMPDLTIKDINGRTNLKVRSKHEQWCIGRFTIKSNSSKWFIPESSGSRLKAVRLRLENRTKKRVDRELASSGEPVFSIIIFSLRFSADCN